jgi:hypothetical protein
VRNGTLGDWLENDLVPEAFARPPDALFGERPSETLARSAQAGVVLAPPSTPEEEGLSALNSLTP